MSGAPPRITDVAAERLRRTLAGSGAEAEPQFEAAQAYSLIGFTQYRLPSYRPSRVHHYVAAHLERVERGEIDRLMIRQQPRTGKSELSARSFPAFCLGRKPSRQFIAASASSSLANDIGRDVRNIIKSDTYGLIYPNVSLSPDAKASGKWTTEQGGCWYSVGVGGDVMGRGAHVWLIDDPYGSMADAQSATIRDNVWKWFNGTVYNRLEPGGAIVIIGHRLHEDDLQGRLEERMRAGSDYDKWTIVELPALAEADDPLGREEGDPLWPERFSLKALERIRSNMFGRDWSALYQQKPVPEEGEFFAVDNLTVKAVPDVVSQVRAWDLASTKGGDFTVGVRFGRTRDGKFVVEHVLRFRGTPDVVEDKILETARADGRSVKVALPKDPGQAGVHQAMALTRLLAGFTISSSPETGDKVTRAKPFAAQCNVGNVSLAGGGWVAGYLDELRSFPHGKYDDQVDASSRAFMELTAAAKMTWVAPISVSGRGIAGDLAAAGLAGPNPFEAGPNPFAESFDYPGGLPTDWNY
jgi:predicted phage terminase large subunit-like protein